MRGVTGAGPGRRGLIDLRPLRSSRPFRRLWAGRALSRLGSQLTVVAVLFQVWRSTHSTVWTGAVGLAGAVPLIAFGLFAGSVSDRADRRKVFLVATGGQAACSAALAAQGFAGWLPVPAVLLLVAALSTFGAAGGPAARTFVPRLLPKELVAAGLALDQVSFQVSLLVGPALAGVMIGWLGTGGCYAVDLASFALAFAAALGLPAMRPDGGAARPGLAGVRDGLGFLLRSPVVRGALFTDLAATVLSFPISLFPLINAERFNDDPRTLGLFLTAIGVGGVLASAFSGAFTRLARPGAVMLAGSATWGAALALFALTPNPWLALGLLALAGVGDTVSVVSRSTLVLLHTPDALRGRVAAAEQIVGSAGPDVGNLRAGLVASAVGGTVALLAGGLLCVAAVALVGAGTPELRRFRVRVDPEGAAATA